MIDDIIKFRSFSEEKQEETIMNFNKLSDDEKTMLAVRIDLGENEYLNQKYLDFLQDIDEYNERQEKKKGRKNRMSSFYFLLTYYINYVILWTFWRGLYD